MPAVIEISIPVRPDFEGLAARTQQTDFALKSAMAQELVDAATCFDNLATTWPHIRARILDSDHRECTRGDFDPCDCRLKPEVAGRLEAERLAWETTAEVIIQKMTGLWKLADRHERTLVSLEYWETIGKEMDWHPRDNL